MPTQPESSTRKSWPASSSRVTYHNVENGFCILRAKARGHRDIVTVVGHAATISAGEWITTTAPTCSSKRIPTHICHSACNICAPIDSRISEWSGSVPLGGRHRGVRRLSCRIELGRRLKPVELVYEH
jgi:hypothetical protein